MKAFRLTARHPRKDDPTKAYFKEIGSVLVSDELAAYINANQERIGVTLNMTPDLFYNAYPDKPEQEQRSQGDSGPF